MSLASFARWNLAKIAVRTIRGTQDDESAAAAFGREEKSLACFENVECIGNFGKAAAR